MVETSAIKFRNHLFINGEWVPSVSGKTFPVFNPATGEVLVEVAFSEQEDVNRAVKAANDSFIERRWLAMTVLERGRILSKVARLIRESQQELATLISLENGMPINTALFVEIPLVIDTFDYFAGLASQVSGQTLPFNMTGGPQEYMTLTLKEPIGVAGLITPWNFPLLMPAWKIAPALAAGCSIVLKPAPQTPLTALKLAEIMSEAGVPEGVINVIPGGDEAGKTLVSHPDVPKIAFTGETATGRHIMASAAQHIKRVTLELGGKSPNIIFADADVEEAVSGSLFGVFLNSGQVCQAGTRIFVQRDLYEPFLTRLTERTAGLTCGAGTDFATDIGPVISAEQLERIEHYIRLGQEQRARLMTGGRKPEGLHGGYFIEPTVFADVRPDMAIAKEEIFGPVVCVIPFDTEDEVVQMANDTIYGLAAAVWTRDIKRALRTVKRIKSGTIWVNTYQVLTPTAPFGGYKQSGLGRELGAHALDAYLETKTVMVDLNEAPMAYF
ncbi:aldehyde dehydrogenase family protein [Aneurinibacillus tyrosinisolvens]|uniref:aldehyde dehydrogenase family protein n=1 Tax=Aneurinibacillus tyrosinisolvens TaxID=1443435 RepID=UPI00063FA21E|nr:aldehyde dehydrogenase family protein [Aneurinibacillus tyrosinisolvens]